MKGKKKRQEMIMLNARLIQDIKRCLDLVSIFEGYCVSIEPYVKSWIKQNIESCELSVHLQNKGIGKKDAKQICVGFGAVLIAHLQYMKEVDIMGPLVPSSVRTKLVQMVDTCRQHHPNVLHQVGTRPTVSRTVTTDYNTHILESMCDMLDFK
jgi:hypothetical protein